MIQRDYFLRIIQEFAKAIGRFIEKKQDNEKRDREMAELYRQYVGDYGTVRNLSVDDTMRYADEQWSADERTDRLDMLAELLYTEASYRQEPLCTMLYDKAYRLYSYVEAHGDTFSIDRQCKIAAIKKLLDGKNTVTDGKNT